MEAQKYYQVNWVDGMKVNKQHFIAQENATLDQIRDTISISLNAYNYGLLPPVSDKNNSLKMSLRIDNQNCLNVKIQECRALTPGGMRIEILENSSDMLGFTIPFPELSYEIENSIEKIFYVLLSVKPFSRQAIGNADPEEEPPRYPFTKPQIKVHLVPEQQMETNEIGLNFITIGKVEIKDSQPLIQSEFIPACCSIQSHPKLKDLHTKYNSFFGQLELDLIKILSKIEEKDQNNELAKAIASLSSDILYFIGTGILNFRWNIANQAPIFMFEFLARCARVMKNKIDTNSGETKEELLNYFVDWCNLKQGEIENILTDTVNFQYEHSRIQKTIITMDQFAEVISVLFKKLSSLEYIGKKKNTGIFVKEQQKDSSFLAD